MRQFTATELAPESAYIFRLSAKTRQGWGEPLEATVITTEKRGKTRGPSPLSWCYRARMGAAHLLGPQLPGSGPAPKGVYTARHLPDRQECPSLLSERLCNWPGWLSHHVGGQLPEARHLVSDVQNHVPS